MRGGSVISETGPTASGAAVWKRISPRQLGLLQFTIIAPTAAISLPGLAMKQAGHDAVYAVLVGGLIGLTVNFVVMSGLGAESPQGQMVRVWGRALALPLLLLFGAGLAFGLMTKWVEFLTMTKLMLLPETPFWAIAILAWLATAAVIGGRMAGIARTNIIFVGLLFAGLLFFDAVAAVHVTVANLRPFAPASLSSITSATLAPASFFAEGVVAATFAGAVNPRRAGDIRKAIVIGTVITLVAVLVSTVEALGTFGARTGGMIQSPWFELLNEVRIGTAFSRNAVVLFSLWTAHILIMLAIWSYALGDTVHHAWPRLPARTASMAGLAVLMSAGLSFMTMTDEMGLISLWGRLVLPIMVGAVLLTGAASFVARRRRTHSQASSS